jgi:hypothetical protein
MERKTVLLRSDLDRVLQRAREQEATATQARREAHDKLAATCSRLEAARMVTVADAQRAREAAEADLSRLRSERAELLMCVRCLGW